MGVNHNQFVIKDVYHDLSFKSVNNDMFVIKGVNHDMFVIKGVNHDQSVIKGVNHDLFVIKGEEEGEYDEDADPDYVPQVGILQNTVTKICNLKLQGFFQANILTHPSKLPLHKKKSVIKTIFLFICLSTSKIVFRDHQCCCMPVKICI